MRSGANVLDLWRKWNQKRYQGGQLGIGGEPDYQSFASEMKVNPQALQKLRQHHQTGTNPITALPRVARIASSFKRHVGGWNWDDHLNGYIATGANKFACDCGEEFTPPKYHKCGGCGKLWNSYVIGTGGDRHQAAIEKFICREIPERPNMLVANRRYAGTHPLSHPQKPGCHRCWSNSSEQGGSDQDYLSLLKEQHHDELTHEFHKDHYLEQQRHPDYGHQNKGPGRYRAANNTGPENSEWWAKQQNPITPSPAPVKPTVAKQKPETMTMDYKRLAGYADDYPEEFPYERLKPGEDPHAGRPKFPKPHWHPEHLDHGEEIEPIYGTESRDTTHEHAW